MSTNTDQSKTPEKRKFQLDKVLIQLTSHRPSDIWLGMEQIRSWLKSDKNDREVYGVLLDAVQKNPELREDARKLLLDMIQHESDVAEQALLRLPTFIPDIMAEADDSYYAGEYSKAIHLYQQIMRLDSENIRAKEHLTKAIKKLETNDTPTGIPRSAKQFYWRARSYLASKETVIAINLLNAAIEAAQASGMNYPEAEETLINIQKANIAEEHVKNAEDFSKQRKYRDALAEYKIAKNLDPTNYHIQNQIRKQYLILSLWWLIPSLILLVGSLIYYYSSLYPMVNQKPTPTVFYTITIESTHSTAPILQSTNTTVAQNPIASRTATITPTPTKTPSPSATFTEVITLTPTENILGEGFINKAIVSAWNEPNKNLLGTLSLNKRVVLLELKNASGSNWYRCRWENGETSIEGWILAEYITLGTP